MNDEVANPYNRSKEWQNVDEEEFVSSDSLFNPTSPKQVDPDNSANLNAKDDPYKVRYDELKKHHDNKLRDLQQELKQVKAEAQAQVPVYQPPKTAEEIAEFKEKNPEIYAVLETEIHNRTSDTNDKVQRLDERESKILAREAQAEIRSIHPDFDSIKVDQNFHDWANAQEEFIQDWIYKNPYDGSKAAKAISLYKSEKGIVTGTVQDTGRPNLDEEAATLLPTRNSGSDTRPEKKVWRESEINKLSPAQFERYEEEIDIAIAEGLFVRG